MAYDIFISFHHKDKVTGERTRASYIAEDLYNDLERMGHKVFYAPKSLHGKIAERFTEEINRALGSAKVLVLIYSTAAELRERWVELEWSTFHRSGRRMIPVMLGVKSEDWANIPRAVRLTEGFDLSDDATDSEYEELLNLIAEVAAQQPAPQPTHETRGAEDASDSDSIHAEVGGIVKFGRYPQSGREPEPIEWRVLDIIDGRALLLSDKLLDSKLYHGKNTPVTWDGCDLRKWLNGEFMNAAFSADEQRRLYRTRLLNPANPMQGTYCGRDTDDYVFCLSIDEVNKYLPSNDDRQALPTAYAASKRIFISDFGTGSWLLRSPGLKKDMAAQIRDCSVDCVGCPVATAQLCVRPAIMLQL